MANISQADLDSLQAEGKVKSDAGDGWYWIETKPGKQTLCKLCNSVDDAKLTKHRLQSFGVAVQPNEQYYYHPDMDGPVVCTGTKQERQAQVRRALEAKGIKPQEILNW